MSDGETAADFRGLLCPLPTVKTALLLEDLAPGAVLEILADDPVTRRDLPGWAREMGHEVSSIRDEGASFRIILKKGVK